MKIVYHGGGFVGFTGAAAFAKAGIDVVVYDVDKSVVEKINNQEIPVYGVEEFLRYQPFGHAGRITSTDIWEEVAQEKIHIIAVPTERQGDPVLEIVQEVVHKIINNREKGTRTILVESTVSPGFTDKTLSKEEWKLATEVGGIYYAICPRRDWFVDPNDDVETTPRVVGGINEQSTKEAVRVLSKVSKVIHQTGYREAEAVKAFENAVFYHSITFGFEFTQAYGDKLDARKVLELQGTHWRLYPLYPSAGIAGYCVPMGLRYLDGMRMSREVDFTIETRWRGFVAAQVLAFLEKNHVKRVLIYGVSEKEKTRVLHFSPTFTLVEKLSKVFPSDEILIADEDYTKEEIAGMGMTATPVELSEISPEDIGVIVLKKGSYIKKFSADVAEDVFVFDCVNAVPEFRSRFSDYVLLGEKR